MARKKTTRKRRSPRKKTAARAGFRGVLRDMRRWSLRAMLWAACLLVLWVVAYAAINPPTTLTIQKEKARLGEIDRAWVDIDEVAPVMLRSVVAAEDANFCLHWGFDMAAIRKALDAGRKRGASTITQQTVKNVFLWQGRNWLRKALEALITPVVEIAWTKRRVLEIYVNVAEFGEGVFGIEAAARHYFGVGPEALSPVQAARLAAVLPSPKTRNPARPTPGLRTRAAAILDGAATIRNDSRSGCF